MWSVKLPASITTMEMMDFRQKGVKVIMVALTSKEVHVYKDKYLVDKFSTDDSVTGMRFGRFGREDSSLIMTTKGKQ